MSVFAYVSGHGFGHWTRSEPLLRRLGVPVHLRTNGRALTQARHAAWAASVVEVDVGPGVVQQGPLAVDVPATRRELSAHLERWPALLEQERREAGAHGVRLVYGDVPPLAFAVAAELGVPSLAMANFTWSWAYAHYAAEDPFFSEAAQRLAAAEGLASRAIHLPGGGGLDALGPATLELALRRRPTCDRAEARRRLPRPPGMEDRPLVLLSFGGYGNELDLSQAAQRNPEFAFLGFSEPQGALPPNLVTLPHDHGLPHQDLVWGADALIAKPGYGTISECLNGPTPFVYVIPGEGFREHRHLERWIHRHLPHARLTPEQLLTGEWTPALRAALSGEAAEPPPPDGLEQALALMRELLG